MSTSRQEARVFVQWLQSHNETAPNLEDPNLSRIASILAPLHGQERMQACEMELDKLGDKGTKIWENLRQAMTELDQPEMEKATQNAQRDTMSAFQELPQNAYLDPALGDNACPWLDDYIRFSQKWSPRSFDGFHEACGLWLLSTIAARRACCHYGGKVYGNLYQIMCGRTTLHAKSTAASIAEQVLQECGLDFFLAYDEATPASFVCSLADTTLPAHFENLPDERKQHILARIGFSGQRGWFYEEFGGCLRSMIRPDGNMADFRSLLRIFDDTPAEYSRATIVRGNEKVERPYLALLANLTPAELSPIANKGASLWGDGFLARFGFVTPPIDEIKRGRYPRGERTIPKNLIDPLVAWHKRLGMPDVQIENSKDGSTPSHAYVKHFPEAVIELPDQVFDAIYVYSDALAELIRDSTIHDLDGNFGRLHIKALRIALLFASLEGCESIDIRHWVRAREIAERRRLYTYRLYEQVTQPGESEKSQIEDMLLGKIKQRGSATAAEIGRTLRTMSAEDIGHYCDRMVDDGLLEYETTRAQTRRYCLPHQTEDGDSSSNDEA